MMLCKRNRLLFWLVVLVTLVALASCSRPLQSSESSQLAPITDFNYTLTMTSSTHGWAFGKNVLVTNDGGFSWRTATPANIENNLKDYKPFVLNHEIAWIAVEHKSELHLYQTKDRGASWTQLASLDAKHIKEYSLFFIDEHEGWISTTTAAGLGYSMLTISHTKDSGQTWTELPTEKTLDQAGNKQFGYFKTSLEGWLGVHDTSKAPYHYYTEDGGQHWLRSLIPYDASEEISWFSVSIPQFYNADEGSFMLYVGSEHEESIRLFYYQTSDGGQSWDYFFIDKVETTQFNEPVSYFVDKHTGWISYNGSTMLKTTDGLDWTKVLNVDYLNEDEINIEQIQFISKAKGWFVLKNKSGRLLYFTEDGGSTWTPQKPQIITN